MKGANNHWQTFKGDDLCFPVEMFAHVMEAAGLDDTAMAERVLANIADDPSAPSAVWKRKLPGHRMGWSDLKPLLMAEFGSHSQPYTLRERVRQALFLNEKLCNSLCSSMATLF